MKAMIRTFCVCFFLFFFFIGKSQNAKRQKEFNISGNNLALQGYDPVSYFVTHKAISGSSKISYIYQGITYYFSSEADKNLFEKNPSAYEPQYGGWCAYAMGNDGSKVDVDPKTFKILNGKLYLFYHTFFNNTLTKWNEDEAHLLSSANEHWTKIF